MYYLMGLHRSGIWCLGGSTDLNFLGAIVQWAGDFWELWIERERA